MNTNKNILEDIRDGKDPFKVPEDYFMNFPDRMMERINHSDIQVPVSRKRILRPWMAWVSGIAAVLVIGWFGLGNYYFKPLQEDRFQEGIALFVDYYGGELHEGQLAGYIEENKIELTDQSALVENALIQIEPGLAEEYIYESVGF